MFDLGLGIGLGLGARGGRASRPRPSDATLAQIVYQSAHVNDPRPNGNTNDWATQGRANLGYDNSKFAFAVPWGVIAIADGQSPNNDVVIKVQDIRLAVQVDGGWQTYTFPLRLAGRYIVESFEGEKDAVAPPWSLAPNPAITDLASGYVWHVYPDAARIDLSGKTLTGLIVAVQAKLESKTGADISGEVGKYLAILGLDFWQSADNPFELPHGTSNQDSFIGSANVIDTSYRWFYGSLSTLDELKAHRPPDWLEQLTQTDPQTLDPDIVPPDDGSNYSISSGFELVEVGYDGLLRYVDLRMIATSGSISWPSYAAVPAAQGDVISVSCYTSVQSGTVSYAEIHAAEVSSGGGYLGNAMAEKTIGPGSLADSLLSANLTLTDASTAKIHGEWYIEGAIGTVIRFHFVTPALVV